LASSAYGAVKDWPLSDTGPKRSDHWRSCVCLALWSEPRAGTQCEASAFGDRAEAEGKDAQM